MVNKFYQFLQRACERCSDKDATLTISGIARTIGCDRSNLWIIGNQDVLTQRKGRIASIARLLREPLSKLLFIAGFNPWGNRVLLRRQEHIWELVERITQMDDENIDILKTYFTGWLKRYKGEQ